jgi:hypothetical protein
MSQAIWQTSSELNGLPLQPVGRLKSGYLMASWDHVTVETLIAIPDSRGRRQLLYSTDE